MSSSFSRHASFLSFSAFLCIATPAAFSQATGAGAVISGNNNSATGTASAAYGNNNSAGGQMPPTRPELTVTGQSAAFGIWNDAFFKSSTAFGKGNTAAAWAASAYGYRNIAAGDGSSAFGRLNSASGANSVALGEGNVAATWSSSAVGRRNTTGEASAVAFGSYNNAYGYHSTAIGQNNYVDGTYAVGMGRYNFITSTSPGGVAIGYENSCSASSYSAAVGMRNVVAGPNSVGFGGNNYAIGANSVAMGYSNVASADTAGAFGIDCAATANHSFAIGYQVNNAVPNSLMIGATDTAKITILSTGNVGIGTTVPGTYKLAVNGQIRTQGVVVENTGWADYVFSDSYQMMPLEQVAEHIKTHRTLPGIPSSAEVAESGVDLGKMQALLLAKVEELTLHVIAQQEQLNRLKAENAELRASITK